MRKFLAAGILAVSALLFPSESRAVPLDVPYQILVGTVSTTGSVVLSTTNFPSGNSLVNANVTGSQWCLSHVVVSSQSAATTLTLAWSTNTLTASTTDFNVTQAANTPYDERWPYRTPYCAPVGQAVLKVTSSVSTAVIAVEGYLWKGWAGY